MRGYTQPTPAPQSSATVSHPSLSPEAMHGLQEGLATFRYNSGLSAEARTAISRVCRLARRDGWTPEQLLICVKDACYTSPEIARLATTSERDAFVSKVITACIQEFFRTDKLD